MDLNELILRYMTLVSDGEHPDYIRDEGVPSDITPVEPESMIATTDAAETETADAESEEEAAEEAVEETEETTEDSAEETETDSDDVSTDEESDESSADDTDKEVE